VLKDSKVDLVEVFLWFGNSAATAALENCIQSLAYESPPFTDEPTYRYRPNKETTSV
jgi:hypothetical protein